MQGTFKSSHLLAHVVHLEGAVGRGPTLSVLLLVDHASLVDIVVRLSWCPVRVSGHLQGERDVVDVVPHKLAVVDLQ